MLNCQLNYQISHQDYIQSFYIHLQHEHSTSTHEQTPPCILNLIVVKSYVPLKRQKKRKTMYNRRTCVTNNNIFE